ncbi:MAG TPA: ChbG/HpnK family deacetylase [Candidatus Saccharimonadales bacterium]|nr:ChbG/HpnK family deacetylase [Candidatus Saccharimonadales bacterium]
MPIVDDFGLFSATDRATLQAAEEGLVTGADVMMGQPTAKYAIDEMREYPDVSLGVHINFSPGVAQRSNGSEALAFRSDPEGGMAQLITQTRRQIGAFQDMTGQDPHHISTHNHTHTNLGGQVFPQFIEAVLDTVGGDGATLIRGVDTQQIRHCRATTLKQGQPPLSPKAFGQLLQANEHVDKPLDLLVHPGLPLHPNQFVMLSDDYTLDMRQQDLAGLRTIIKSGVVEQADYKLVSPTEWLTRRSKKWPGPKTK